MLVALAGLSVLCVAGPAEARHESADVKVKAPHTHVSVRHHTVRVRAPHTRVAVREGGRVRVDAPYTRVGVREGRVRVSAPFTNVDVRW